MTGGVNPGDQRALHCLVQGLKPRHVLEIGTHIGCSTVHLALALKRLAGTNGQQIRLTSADIRDVNDPVQQPWKEYASRHSPREMIEMVGCGDFVRFEVADSLDYLAGASGPYDLIFLDGWHKGHRVYQELPLALKRLRPGGFILLHDYFPNCRPLWSNRMVIAGPFLGVQRTIRDGARLKVLPFGKLPWPTKIGIERHQPGPGCRQRQVTSTHRAETKDGHSGQGTEIWP